MHLLISELHLLLLGFAGRGKARETVAANPHSGEGCIERRNPGGLGCGLPVGSDVARGWVDAEGQEGILPRRCVGELGQVLLQILFGDGDGICTPNEGKIVDVDRCISAVIDSTRSPKPKLRAAVTAVSRWAIRTAPAES